VPYFFQVTSSLQLEEPPSSIVMHVPPPVLGVQSLLMTIPVESTQVLQT